MAGLYPFAEALAKRIYEAARVQGEKRDIYEQVARHVEGEYKERD